MTIQDDNTSPPPLLSTFDTAEFLGVPRQTLAAWRSRGTGPVFIQIGRHIKYRVDDLDAWIATNTITPKEQS